MQVKHLLRPCFQEMGRQDTWLIMVHADPSIGRLETCASNGGKLHFAHLQKIVLQNQRARLQAVV